MLIERKFWKHSKFERNMFLIKFLVFFGYLGYCTLVILVQRVVNTNEDLA